MARHGEKNSSHCNRLLDVAAHFFGLDLGRLANLKLDFHQADRVATGDLIKKADQVISTVSTVILDCEIHQKSTVLYDSDSVRALLNKLKQKITFRCVDDLDASLYKFNTLKSSLLFVFDAVACTDFFLEEYNSNYVSRSKVFLSE